MLWEKDEASDDNQSLLYLHCLLHGKRAAHLVTSKALTVSKTCYSRINVPNILHLSFVTFLIIQKYIFTIK